MPIPFDIPTVAAAAVVCICLYQFIVHPAFISPLSKIPAAHPTASISPAWILWKRFTFREIRTIHEAHQRLGPVIRLGPKEISINCVKGGIQTVYSGGFEKHAWYPNLFDNYGIPNMFSTAEGKPHSVRKRMLSNIYSKSNLQNSPAMAVKTKILLYDRFLPTMAEFAKSSVPFDIYAHISAATMDFVTSYQFGLASSADLMRDKKQWKEFLAVYQIRQSFNFWPQELPGLTSFLKTLGIRMVPNWVDEANHGIESWVLTMCSGAAETLRKQNKTTMDPSADSLCDVPEVYSQLKAAMNKNSSKSDAASATDTVSRQQLEIASELLDHLAAGFDTSGITLTYFVHEISQRPEVQTALRKELRSLDQPLIFEPGKDVIPSAKALDSLPLLQAILQETLRLRAAIPGPEPRITPATGCVLGPNGEYHVPGGVRVSAQAHSLHRNSEVFENPKEWIPGRWLKPADDEHLKEMNRWFWAFGSGGRMCVGSNLAIYQMKYILAAIYTNFTTTLVDDDGIEQRDLYTAPPTGGKLIVKLEVAST